MIWFSADYHFGHDNIIGFVNRPFKNIHSMEKATIERHNSLVSSGDTVYFLGDFSLYGSEYYKWFEKIIPKFNGTKHLILGNHDRLKPFAYISAGFASVHTSLELIYNDNTYIMVHDPAVATIQMSKPVRWLCGHIHLVFKKLNNILNVGIDVHGYNPISIEDVERLFAEEM